MKSIVLINNVSQNKILNRSYWRRRGGGGVSASMYIQLAHHLWNWKMGRQHAALALLLTVRIGGSAASSSL